MDQNPTALFDRVLGIDPGLNTTGYGVVEASERGIKLLEAGVVRSTAKRSLPDRVKEIHEGVAEVIANFEPHAVAIEELYSHYERPRTAILMGHAGCHLPGRINREPRYSPLRSNKCKEDAYRQWAGAQITGTNGHPTRIWAEAAA